MPLRPDMETSDYLEILQRRQWYIVFSILLILFGASVYSVITPEKYKSSTTILVIPQRVPEGYVRSTISASVDERLFTIRQQVLSRTRLLAVMEELGIYKEERKKLPAEVVVETMRKSIAIQVASAAGAGGRRRDSGEDAFTLTVIHENPQLAMLTASRLASYFIDENLKSREQQAVGTSEFLESQLQETKVRLEAQEEKVKQYKLQFMGELPQQLQANLQILSRLQDQLKMNSDATRVAQDRKGYLDVQIGILESQLNAIAAQMSASERAAREAAAGGSDAPAVSGMSTAALANELSVKKSQLAALSAKYTEKYPEIRRLKEELVQLEKRLAETIAQEGYRDSALLPQSQSAGTAGYGLSPGSRERDEILRLRAQNKALDSEIASLRKERQGIEKAIATLEARVEKSPRREQEMVSLTRDYENLKLSYDDLLKKKLDAEVSQNLEKRQKGEQFQILDPADLPQKPFSPDRPKVYGIAFIAAMFIGFGGAIGFEMINPTLRGKRDFQHFFQVPVLASIPVIRDTEYEARKSRQLTIVYGGLVSFGAMVTLFLVVFGHKVRTLLLGDVLVITFPFFRKSDTRPAARRAVDLFEVGNGDLLFTEKFKGLRAMVEQKADVHQMRLLGITSSIAGEGKTLTCAQLGRSLASTGRKKVLMVDMDVRKADLTRGMGARRSPGLTEHLLGGATFEQILRQTQVTNLSLVTSGADVNSPADLLAGEKFKSFLQMIRKSFDMIFLDTPPVLPVADTPTIREMTDGFLFVYRAGFTPYTMLRQAMEELGERNILGVILNGVEVASDSYYRKYYGAYYHRAVEIAVDSTKTGEAVR